MTGCELFGRNPAKSTSDSPCKILLAHDPRVDVRKQSGAQKDLPCYMMYVVKRGAETQ